MPTTSRRRLPVLLLALAALAASAVAVAIVLKIRADSMLGGPGQSVRYSTEPLTGVDPFEAINQASAAAFVAIALVFALVVTAGIAGVRAILRRRGTARPMSNDRQASTD